MMEEDGYNNKYDALASTIQFKNITSDEQNQNILRRLKHNDPRFDKLWICNQDQIHDEFDFWPTNGKELGWLGYFIGGNTTLQRLTICSTLPPSCDNGIEDFRRGLARNKSIRKIFFWYHRLDRQIFHMLDLFFKNTDNNLSEIEVEECELGAEGSRLLSSMLRASKSLQTAILSNNGVGDDQLVDIIASLSMHPQLEYLVLTYMSIGRSECSALATLLSNTTKQLQTLDLDGNNIDDEGIEALTHAISGSNLQVLDLSRNQTITIRGWERLSTLLETPYSNLERLSLQYNNIGDEGALIFTNALKGNCKLKVLSLHGNGVTTEGWIPFSRLLCDTSSVNSTFLSNHTLGDFGTHGVGDVPTGVLSFRILNSSSEDKGQIAMTKILQHHSHFNMEPFFEWEFKVLPLMIAWLEKARALTSNFEEKIKRTKLSITYDFVREFPMLYIEPVTRKEIEECSVVEIELQGKCQQAKLEEVQQRKERAVRRL